MSSISKILNNFCQILRIVSKYEKIIRIFKKDSEIFIKLFKFKLNFFPLEAKFQILVNLL